jgi:hypothetical protein
MQGVAAVGVRLGKIRPQHKRAVAGAQRFVEALQGDERIRAIGMRLCRAQLDRAVIARQRILEPLQLLERIAPIGVRFGIVQPRRDRAVVAR